MRNIIVILLTALLFISCKKENLNPAFQLKKLPAETQTGADTFGCLVNGKAFTPNNNIFSPVQNKHAHYYYDGIDQNFNVSGSRSSDKDYPVINILADFLTIEEGKTYQFKKKDKGNVYGTYEVLDNKINKYSVDRISYFTTTERGELHITRFDQAKQVVSGTFWFDAVNEKGEVVAIRNGRFDLPL